ncbi:MAG: efflux RND transporter periplasmic adaptor subunit [Marinifilaceae bacterium]
MRNCQSLYGLLILAATAASCQTEVRRASNESVTPVSVQEVGKRNIEKTITTTGTAKAIKNIELKSEMTGSYNLQRNPKTGKPYQLGDVVEAGAVIVRFDNQEYVNNQQLESKKLQVQIAEKEWEGQEMLYKKGGATEKDVNNAKNSFINSKTSLENAEISLGKMTIKAPFKGVIVTLPYFTPGIEVASGSSIVSLMDYSKMYIEGQFPENILSDLTKGQNVYITHYNLKRDTLSAIVDQLSPAINEDTRTFSGMILVNNDGLKLRPGMFAKADIVTERRDSVIAVPKDIIKNSRGNRTVFVVERNTAEERSVKIGISDDEYVEITSGLKPGDRIVVKGNEWLNNRSKVKIMK